MPYYYFEHPGYPYDSPSGFPHIIRHEPKIRAHLHEIEDRPLFCDYIVTFLDSIQIHYPTAVVDFLDRANRVFRVKATMPRGKQGFLIRRDKETVVVRSDARQVTQSCIVTY
jgi:hypothetical protein